MMLAKNQKIKNRKKERKKSKIFFCLFIAIIVLAGIASFYYVKDIKHPASVKSITYRSKTVSNTQTMSSLKQLLEQRGISFSKIIINSNEYIIYTSDGSEVILSSKKNLDLQISSLQYIIQRLTMEGRQFSKLDERFDNPVIVFRQ